MNRIKLLYIIKFDYDEFIYPIPNKRVYNIKQSKERSI